MADLSALTALTGEEPVWPDPLEPDAYHGIVGQIVTALEPHTEADPAGLHITILTLAGNVIGRGPYFQIEGDRHHVNLYAGIVGATAGGKGVSLGRGKQVVSPADPEWAQKKMVDGLSTGEGLIWHVRDPIEERRPAKDEDVWNADEDGMVTELIDPGVTDKRVMAVSSEFAQTLTAASRDNNTLSPVLRSLWDSGDGGVLTRSSPVRVTGAHVSAIAHITPQELAKKLSATESANGFGNRFIWVAVKRSKRLPLGGNLTDEELDPLIIGLTEAIHGARGIGQMTMSPDAEEVWSHAYVHELTRERDGLFGAICGRAHAISLRFAVLFAALDGSNVIEAPHINAALATWRRAEQSAAFLFGGSSGDHLTDRILSVIKGTGAAGLLRSEIREELGSHAFTADRIGRALDDLRDQGRIEAVVERDGGRGRNPERWTAVELPPISPTEQGEA